MFDLLQEHKNNNNLYIIRNKHRNIIFISPMLFDDFIYNEGNIESFYNNIYTQNHDKIDIQRELLELENQKTSTFYYTQNALLPLNSEFMTFSANNTRFYIEHYHLIEDIDPLTGLPTRTTLKLNFEDITLSRDSLSLVFIDFDKFEEFNQSMGYIKADFILQRVAQLMRSHFHPNEVYRYGGDEFIILIKDDVEFVRSVNAFKDKIHKIQTLVDFDFSYGIGRYPSNGVKLPDLVSYASELMKKQKMSKKK